MPSNENRPKTYCMNAKPATENILSTSEAPLDRLVQMLDDDMKAVNTKIMDNLESGVKLIPQLASYLIASGGKRIRPLLTLAATQMYDGEIVRAHSLATAVEFIHTATLLHDDVIDESQMRRGQDAANLVFGNQATILVGDFLFARAFQLMTADNDLRVLKTLSDASVIITEGEVQQLSLAGNIDTEMEQYFSVIEAKTAALFAAACEVGPLIAGKDDNHAKALRGYGHHLGIAFQIADDALDYAADENTLGKVVGDDFREGKMTAPVIIALKEAGEDERAFWKRMFSENNFKDEDLKTAQNYLNTHDAIEKTLTLSKTHSEKAKGALDQAPQGKFKDTLIDIADYVVNRET
ncbi:MAG: polyprenyl synthetase family protein [Pseudomonadota bacterium]